MILCVCVCVCVRACVCACVRACVLACVRACVSACVRVNLCTTEHSAPLTLLKCTTGISAWSALSGSSSCLISYTQYNTLQPYRPTSTTVGYMDLNITTESTKLCTYVLESFDAKAVSTCDSMKIIPSDLQTQLTSILIILWIFKSLTG